MRELICWDMVSLDGYFEAPGGDLDWFAFDDELERYILDTQRDAGTLLFGRVTYQMMAAYWPAATGEIAEFMNTVPKVVVSTTLRDTDWPPTTVVRGELEREVTELKRQTGGPIFVFGSARLTASLLRLGLVDELRTGICPILLGEGTPLFKPGIGRRPLRLAGTRTFGSGLVILQHRPA